MAVISRESNTRSQAGWPLVFIAWFVVTIATAGSLFFSEVMKIPICELCWYQRVAMYPLVLILALSLFPYDPRVVRVAGALVAMGWLIALFQVLLVAGIIPEEIRPCVQGIPCSETHITLLGFLNIPTWSLLTFSIVGILLLFTHRIEKS
jgi:disulfide bond formation protein DsbB